MKLHSAYIGLIASLALAGCKEMEADNLKSLVNESVEEEWIRRDTINLPTTPVYFIKAWKRLNAELPNSEAHIYKQSLSTKSVEISGVMYDLCLLDIGSGRRCLIVAMVRTKTPGMQAQIVGLYTRAIAYGSQKISYVDLDASRLLRVSLISSFKISQQLSVELKIPIKELGL
jgi:hypothetical protein